MKKMIIAAALITALLLVFTGCSNANPDASAAPSVSPGASTAVADPSASPAASAIAVTVKGSDYVSVLVTELGTAYMDGSTDVTINTSATNSNTAIASVADGNADIALSSRPLKDEEKAVLTGLKEDLICRDGLVVFVSKDCPVSTLSAQQIKDIFMGTITNWKEAGGTDSDITVYAMGSGTDIRKRFNEQFLGADEQGAQNDSVGASAADNADMADKIGGDAAAIGYMPLSAIHADGNVKAITIDAVLPTADNIKSGRYVYVLNYYLITDDPSDAAKAFVDYCKGNEAQATIIEKGLIVS
jgi:phosphate transport system substrate-binding protein